MRDILFIALVLSTFVGCSRRALTKNERFSKKELLPDLYLVQPEHIAFNFELQIIPIDTAEISPGKKRLVGGYGILTCYLKNNGARTEYFLDYSCSDYPGEIIFDQPGCSTFQTIHCNASLPEIITLDPNETKQFSTHVTYGKHPEVGIKQWCIKFVNCFIERTALYDNTKYDSIIAIRYDKCIRLIPQSISKTK